MYEGLTGKRLECANLYKWIIIIILLSAVALFVSFLINVFVVAVFAAAFSGEEYSEASIKNAVSTAYIIIIIIIGF